MFVKVLFILTLFLTLLTVQGSRFMFDIEASKMLSVKFKFYTIYYITEKKNIVDAKKLLKSFDISSEIA